MEGYVSDGCRAYAEYGNQTAQPTLALAETAACGRARMWLARRNGTHCQQPSACRRWNNSTDDHGAESCLRRWNRACLRWQATARRLLEPESDMGCQPSRR